MIAPEKRSAGLLMFRRRGALEVLLVHPGGPFFRKKDAGAWSIPKGGPEPGETLQATAVREFHEETGLIAGQPLMALGEIQQKGGKYVTAWAFEGDLPAGWTLRSMEFQLEWPPRSGRMRTFPEADRAEFFPVPVAREKINAAQAAFLDRLEAMLAGPAAPAVKP